MPKYLKLTWEDVDKDISALAHKLAPELEKRSIKEIYLVSRGGLVPASIVARELDMHYLDTICIESYDSTVQNSEAKVLKMADGTGVNTLVIDDLVDSGETLKLIRKKMPEALFATVYAKPQGKPYTDVYYRDIEQDVWVMFPWEKYDIEA